MERVLYLVDPKWGPKEWRSAGKTPAICDRILRLKLDVPKDCKKLVAVFSKKRPRHRQYFTITKGGFWKDWGVVEYRGAYMDYASNTIRRAYVDGYRYIHFEVEV